MVILLTSQYLKRVNTWMTVSGSTFSIILHQKNLEVNFLNLKAILVTDYLHCYKYTDFTWHHRIFQPDEWIHLYQSFNLITHPIYHANQSTFCCRFSWCKDWMQQAAKFLLLYSSFLVKASKLNGELKR